MLFSYIYLPIVFMFLFHNFFFYFISRTLKTQQNASATHAHTHTCARTQYVHTYIYVLLFIYIYILYTQQYYFNVYYNPANRTNEIEGEIVVVVVVIHPLEGRVIYEPASMKYGRPVAPRVHTHIFNEYTRRPT